MFSIYHRNVLIGHSALEDGDPPMGVASGLFEPTEAFAPLRGEMVPAVDGAGKVQRDLRFLSNLSARTPEGIALVCADVSVAECGDFDDPFALEVCCLGISQPPYAELFPDHVKAYEDQFKKHGIDEG